MGHRERNTKPAGGNLGNSRWGLLDQFFGAFFLTATSILLTNSIVITLCHWNPFAVPPRDSLFMMLLISPTLLCLFLVGYFMQKKIRWPWTVLAGVLIAIRVCALHS